MISNTFQFGSDLSESNVFAFGSPKPVEAISPLIETAKSFNKQKPSISETYYLQLSGSSSELHSQEVRQAWKDMDISLLFSFPGHQSYILEIKSDPKTNLKFLLSWIFEDTAQRFKKKGFHSKILNIWTLHDVLTHLHEHKNDFTCSSLSKNLYLESTIHWDKIRQTFLLQKLRENHGFSAQTFDGKRVYPQVTRIFLPFHVSNRWFWYHE